MKNYGGCCGVMEDLLGVISLAIAFVMVYTSRDVIFSMQAYEYPAVLATLSYPIAEVIFGVVLAFMLFCHQACPQCHGRHCYKGTGAYLVKTEVTDIQKVRQYRERRIKHTYNKTYVCSNCRYEHNKTFVRTHSEFVRDER